MIHHISTAKSSRDVICMFLLLLLLMLIDVSKAIPTDMNDVTADKCAFTKCQTDNECPADSKWQAIYTPDDSDYPADNAAVAAIAASTLEEQPFIKSYFGEQHEEELESELELEVASDTENDDENYDVLEAATNNPFDNIKIEVLGVTEANRCCIERKCICRECPPMPKCAANEVIVEVRAAFGVPGKCCAKYSCTPEINCNNVVDEQKGAKEFWRDACTKCRCFGGDVLCHSQCQIDELKNLHHNCFSKQLQLSMVHGSTWFEDNYCSECNCENGEKHCVTKLCNNNALDCKHPIKRPFKCCPECPDEPIPIVEHVENVATSTTESYSKTILVNSTFTTTETTLSSFVANSISNSTLENITTTTTEQNNIIMSSTTASISEETSVPLEFEVENTTNVEETSTAEVSWTTETASESTDSTTNEIYSTSNNNNKKNNDNSSNNNTTTFNLTNLTETTALESSTTSSAASTVDAFSFQTSRQYNEIKNKTETAAPPMPNSSTQESSIYSTYSTILATEATEATATKTAASETTTTTTAATTNIDAAATTNIFSSKKAATSTSETVTASTSTIITTAFTSSPTTTATATATSISISTSTTEASSSTTPYTQLTHAPTTTSAPAPLEPQPTVYRQLNTDEYEQQDIANTEEQHRFLDYDIKNIIFGGLILFAGAAFIVLIWWACHTKHRRQVYSAIPKSETLGGFNSGVVTIATTGLNNSIKERKYYSTTPKSECSLSANSTSASVLTVESG